MCSLGPSNLPAGRYRVAVSVFATQPDAAANLRSRRIEHDFELVGGSSPQIVEVSVALDAGSGRSGARLTSGRRRVPWYTRPHAQARGREQGLRCQRLPGGRGPAARRRAEGVPDRGAGACVRRSDEVLRPAPPALPDRARRGSGEADREPPPRGHLHRGAHAGDAGPGGGAGGAGAGADPGAGGRGQPAQRRGHPAQRRPLRRAGGAGAGRSGAAVGGGGADRPGRGRVGADAVRAGAGPGAGGRPAGGLRGRGDGGAGRPRRPARAAAGSAAAADRVGGRGVARRRSPSRPTPP